MKRLIIVGSPRTNGRSAHLAEMLFEANIDEHPEDELFLVPVSEVEVGPCIGCDACREKSGVILKGDDGGEVTVQRHRCVFDDDMQAIYDLLDDVDEVTVVSPVYFSGAPAPMKCVLDRLQPYYWAGVEARERDGVLPEKRPLALHVIGEGGDPHGYGALVSEVRSAFALAGFRLERMLDWVGKINRAGEITAEAVEVPVEPRSIAAGLTGSASGDGAAAVAGQQTRVQAHARKAGLKPRPKLDLHSGIRDDETSAKEPRKGQGASRQAQGKTQGKARQAAKNPTPGPKKKQGKRRGK